MSLPIIFRTRSNAMLLAVKMIEHGGATNGFKSNVIRFPDDGLGITLLSNSETASPALDILEYHLAEVYS